MGTNGTAPISRSVVSNQTPLTSVLSDNRNEILEKKELCAKYLKQAEVIVDKFNDTTGYSTLEKICFSKTNSSCFALITERERFGYQKETFVTVDLLSGERTDVSKIIFTDDDPSATTKKMMTFNTAKDKLLKSIDCLY